MIMSLSFTKNLINRAPEYAEGEIDHNLTVAEKALKQLRTLLFDLRPVILETQGLIAALEMYSERLQETDNLKVLLTIENGFERLSAKAEVAIFAIVQEAINNAKKYAQATHIDLTVQANEKQDTLTVFIKDDGCGFDVKQVKARYEEQGSLGLINMQERAEMIGGTLKIHSEIGRGTKVFLSLPLSENFKKNEDE